MKHLLFFPLLFSLLFAQDIRPGDYIVTQTIQYDTITSSIQHAVEVLDWETTPTGMRTYMVRKDGSSMRIEVRGGRYLLDGMSVQYDAATMTLWHGDSIRVSYKFDRRLFQSIKF